MQKLATLILFVALIAAFLLGATVNSHLQIRPAPSPTPTPLPTPGWAGTARTVTDVGFWIALRILALATLGGLAWAGVRLAHRRASTIYPNEHGLAPVVIRRVGKAVVLYDMNRELATVLLPDGKKGVRIERMEGPYQLQISTQAQAVQGIRAAVSGKGGFGPGDVAGFLQRVTRGPVGVRVLAEEVPLLEGELVYGDDGSKGE